MRPAINESRSKIGNAYASSWFIASCGNYGHAGPFPFSTQALSGRILKKSASVSGYRTVDPFPLPTNYSMRVGGYNVNGGTLRYDALYGPVVPPCGVSREVVTAHQEYDANVSFPGYPFTTYSSSLDDSVVTRLLNNVKDVRFDAGLALAEFDQTARLVGDTINRIGNSIVLFQRRRPSLWKAVRRAFSNPDTLRIVRNGQNVRYSASRIEVYGKHIPSAWLELQYGWKPLMSDVNGAITALRRRSNLDFYRSARSRIRQSTGDITISFPVGVNGHIDVIVERMESCEYKVWFSTSNLILSQLASLGLTNPASLVWEKLPYSFVLDWFLPIGQTLSAMDATIGKEFYTGYISKCIKFNTRSSKFVITYPGVTGGSGISATFNNCVQFDRSGLSSFPPVPFPVRDTRTSLTHIANGLSLISTYLNRG